MSRRNIRGITYRAYGNYNHKKSALIRAVKEMKKGHKVAIKEHPYDGKTILYTSVKKERREKR